MAQQTNKDILTRLADRGEQVVGRITDLPGAKMLLDTTTALTKRIDDMQRRLRSLDPLEKRVTALEKRLEKLEGKSSAKPATKRTSSARSTTAKAAPKKTTRKSTTTRRQPPSSSS
jgi:TolA-binding protein